MARIVTTSMIEWDTTPAKLRELANDLEAQWAGAKLGDEVPFVIVRGSNAIVLKIGIDQVEIHAEKK